MHMADALISPAVGGALWVISGVTAAYAGKKMAESKENQIIPLMGVLGAFIFAIQMINFSIPLTGSSGHLGGGLLLAILLGPHAAFLTMFSILGVQALFFADGGLLALGSNIFNLGVIPAYFVYPFIYKPLMARFGRFRFAVVAFSAIIGLQLGAFGVVVETLLSGVSSLPFTKFLILMQPIHLGIGLVEGIVTALVVEFIYRSTPDYFKGLDFVKHSIKKLTVAFIAVAFICGGFVSYFASSDPDGLEWSIGKVAGVDELETSEAGVYGLVSNIQEQFAFLPDYSFADNSLIGEKLGILGGGLSGVIGVFIVLLLAGGTGWMLIKRKGDR